MDIDLGQEVVYNVKLGDKKFTLSEPTVKEMQTLFLSLKDGASEVDEFLSLLVKLGLPEDDANSLGLNKMKKLVDCIMGVGPEKK